MIKGLQDQITNLQNMMLTCQPNKTLNRSNSYQRSTASINNRSITPASQGRLEDESRYVMTVKKSSLDLTADKENENFEYSQT